LTQRTYCFNTYSVLLSSALIYGNRSYVDAYLKRLAPTDDVDIETDQAEREAYFDRLRKFIWKLSPAFNKYRVSYLA